ncbi:dynamin family protein [uncultured Roseobacter sp.]|uniref:dynamin family protein n=1 Tax=uncultured Roseobacter sp. TaxID=114847 RepID=UPI0026372584|nr:dynamin family protein [uncultured Roseobacter sp.]
MPRIALMGEFSAGKSTLANLMIGTNHLPEQVIATQLPPVWVTWGDSEPVLVGLDGTEKECDLKNPGSIPSEGTAYIRVCCREEILKHCDILDLPGISDPNMSSDVWERVLPLADGVVWCSPATQAWRQSEAAVWKSLPEELHARSLLLLTRGDMLATQRDKARVLRRVTAETQDVFADTLMISLLQARDSGDDETLWEESGADQFVARFLEIVGSLREEIAARGELPDDQPLPVGLASYEADPEVGEPELLYTAAEGSVTPRRPVTSGQRVVRPARPDPDEDDEVSFAPKFS